jgi:hypothetical protein
MPASLYNKESYLNGIGFKAANQKRYFRIREKYLLIHIDETPLLKVGNQYIMSIYYGLPLNQQTS